MGCFTSKSSNDDLSGQGNKSKSSNDDLSGQGNKSKSSNDDLSGQGNKSKSSNDDSSGQGNKSKSSNDDSSGQGNKSKSSNDDITQSQEDNLIDLDNTVPEFSLLGKEVLGKIVSCYDGDTARFIILVDNSYVKFNCRMNGIDAPEIRLPQTLDNEDRQRMKRLAYNARNRLIQLCTDCKIELDGDYSKRDLQTILDKNKQLLFIVCHEFDKYGRLLINVYSRDKTTHINQIMIGEGHAYAYDGGTKQV